MVRPLLIFALALTTLPGLGQSLIQRQAKVDPAVPGYVPRAQVSSEVVTVGEGANVAMLRDALGLDKLVTAALERSAIYKALRRFFREVAVAAAARDGAPGSADFLNASTHWLRHTFANSAVKQMQPQVLQSLLGHSDLRVTSVYVKADAVDLVRGMRAMQRAAEGTLPK